MATITLHPAETINIDTDNLVLRKVIDNPIEQIITATVENIYRDIILWQGSEEYTEAGIWTNESSLARAKAILESGNVQFN
jgi:hypothetical protein